MKFWLQWVVWTWWYWIRIPTLCSFKVIQYLIHLYTYFWSLTGSSTLLTVLETASCSMSDFSLFYSNFSIFCQGAFTYDVRCFFCIFDLPTIIKYFTTSYVVKSDAAWRRSVNFKMSFWCLHIFQKTNEIFSRISALASKKRSNKEIRTFYIANRRILFRLLF